MMKLKVAAFLAGLLALSIAPAQGAESITPNDTARFLAGLPPAPDSPLAALTKDPIWQQHAKYMNSIFGQEERNHLTKIRAFADARLGMPHDTMLYMFSGPDFLHATAFFPKATNYVLAALEPAGAIPPLNTLSRGAVAQTLRNLEISTRTLLTISFFITKNMAAQLHNGPVFGTLPVMYVFLARTGKTVHETSFVYLDEQGSVHEGTDARSQAKGVKIVFSDGDGPMQTLFYFSTDLANGGVNRSGFLAFCAGLGVADSFIKSDSYLLHSGAFSTVRNFLLDDSATILQDDSGIPVSLFDRRKWEVQPFGRYVGPIAVFARNYQYQMADLYRRGNAIPIDFGLGYRWRTNESNLLLAQKIEPKASSEPATADAKPAIDQPQVAARHRRSGRRSN